MWFVVLVAVLAIAWVPRHVFAIIGAMLVLAYAQALNPALGSALTALVALSATLWIIAQGAKRENRIGAIGRRK